MGAPSSEFREVERREEPDRLEAAKRIDDNYRESSFERERQFRAAVASGAAYLTLMATASIQGLQTVTDVAGREATVRTAQFFLTILAALILRYTIASIRGLTEDIVDNAARHHELEALDSRIEPSDMRLAADNAAYRRTGRVFRYIRPRLSAAIPRSGKSRSSSALCLLRYPPPGSPWPQHARRPSTWRWWASRPSPARPGYGFCLWGRSTGCGSIRAAASSSGARRSSDLRVGGGGTACPLTPEIEKALEKSPPLPVRAEIDTDLWPEACRQLYGISDERRADQGTSHNEAIEGAPLPGR